MTRSLLLASAAVLMPLAAQAADLPSRKAAPVEYVRVCSAQGAGFFYIPGTDTCLSIGGRLRAEYRYFEPRYSVAGNGRAQQVSGFRAIGRLNIDARTQTAYGLLRTYVRFDLNGDTGSYVGGPGTNNGAVLDKGYIQFAGFTAGRAQSFFDFFADDWNYSTGILNGFGSDNGNTNLLAYTATFGGGFSATLSLEDRNQRSVTPTAYSQAGERIPDVVANVLYESGWGSAQLSGALHQVSTTALDGFGGRIDNEYGFAVQGGVKVNLPMLSQGDVLWLQAAYAEGALNYLGVGNSSSIGVLNQNFADAALVGGSLKKSDGYSLTATFTHYWVPTFKTSVLGNYTYIDVSNQVTTASANGLGLKDARLWSVVGQAAWLPVKDMEIGVEVLYTKLDPSGGPVLVGNRFKGSEDIVEGRLRFQRDF